MDKPAFMDIVASGVLSKDPVASPVPARGDTGRAKAALSIYRNNVRTALSRALGDTYPVIAALVGDEFFKAMANAYFTAHPPHSPMIIEYGRRFPEFLSSFPPAASLPYLSDVARLEWAWLMAYRAADATSLTSGAIMAAGDDNPSALHFDLHPSVTIISSPFPVASIWRKHRPDGSQISVDMNIGEDVLIVRPENTVDLHTLLPGAATVFAALQRGATIADAFAYAQQETSDFDPRALFALVLSSGVAIAASTRTHTKGQ